MYFCDNEECKLHVDVNFETFLKGILFVDDYGFDNRQTKQRIERHDYEFYSGDKLNRTISFCSVCVNAIKMCNTTEGIYNVA